MVSNDNRVNEGTGRLRTITLRSLIALVAVFVGLRFAGHLGTQSARTAPQAIARADAQGSPPDGARQTSLTPSILSRARDGISRLGGTPEKQSADRTSAP